MSDLRKGGSAATGPVSEAEIGRLIARSAAPLPPLEDTEAFGAAFDRFAAARVVLLGEATHGTSEFYRARAAITRRLIERHGFSIVAVEADWPDAARIDRWVRRRGTAQPEEGPAFARFPTWMWRNAEMRDFVGWLRAHNAELLPERRAEFRGLDVYSLGASIAAVLAYLDATDPEAAKAARRRYACLTPWHMEPSDYGRAVLFGDREPCEDAAVQQLRDLLARQATEMATEAGEQLFDAAQNARVALGAERYYRLMYRSGTESWNLRDRHMFDTLRALLDRRGPRAKAVVWAHNSHIGNAAATEMGWQGEFNIGELCRTAFGEDAALIGFCTDHGTVAAADDWDGEMAIMSIRPVRKDSHEALFRAHAPACSLTDLRPQASPELRTALAQPRLERAIGVVYRPESERRSHYFEAVLPEQFDGFVWFAETRAVTPLPGVEEEGGDAAETFPFGL
jgi:erythromycin esterase-like protein